MVAPAHALRAIFALSTFACATILVLFVHGRAAWTTGFWVQVVAAAVAATSVTCWFAFRRGAMRLVGTSVQQLARVFLPQLVYAYIASALAITAIALAVIYGVTRSGANSLALAVLAGLWLSLWLAPGIAAMRSWLRLRSRAEHDA